MSSFGAKRKARVIKVTDEEDRAGEVPSPSESEGVQDREFPRFFLRMLLMLDKG